VARYRILSWKDIPSVVEATDGEEHAKVQLSERFQMLIDTVAMQLGMDGTDAYLEQWEHGAIEERPGRAREVADAVAADLEMRFGEFRQRSLGAA
jgi:hypothetical protein